MYVWRKSKFGKCLLLVFAGKMEIGAVLDLLPCNCPASAGNGWRSIMNDIIENKTFDEIQVGDRASLTRALDRDGVEALGIITGNFNLIDGAAST